jgi:hypothetical protein
LHSFYITCEVSKNLFIHIAKSFATNITIKLTSLMLSWPPGPCLTLIALIDQLPLDIETKTYRRVGLKSVGTSGSQMFAILVFPPGFSRTRLRENSISNSDSEHKGRQRACWVLHWK